MTTHFISDIFRMVVCQSKFKKMQGKCFGCTYYFFSIVQSVRYNLFEEVPVIS